MFNKFYGKKLILLKIILTCFILLVSLQIGRQQENVDFSVRELELAFNYLFNRNERAIRVSEKNSQIEQINLKTQNYESYPGARLIINGSTIGDFSEGELTIQVRAHDLIVINTSAYDENIIFIIEDLSDDIKNLYPGQQFISDGDWLVIDYIEIGDRI